MIRTWLWAVLGAIAGMIPASSDMDGHAAGVSSIAEISERARLSRNRTRNALAYFRANRILWLRFQARTVEVKFQRQVVVGLLAAQKVAPLEVRRLIEAHGRRREVAAPLVKSANTEFSGL